MEKAMIKYRHCGRDVVSFSSDDVSVRQCPVCRQTLTFGLLDAPVAITCPFTNGHKVSCAFLIGSVHGPSHLGEWSDTEIHVGLSNSEGLVYNYTLSGIRRDAQGWENCVCIPLAPPERRELRELWDTELERFSVLPEWTSERFSEERAFGSCCYGFALSFINRMRRLDGRAALSREHFTGCHILPRMKTVSQYINIYHAILQHGFYIMNTPDDT
ncbi:MKRN2 opposite strand, tandem duplicate 1 [Pseudorasbora parva]|uniref:MKRN2 opposite strand, tandem duplicate 1 n=1 Tax=Pseudorasbora parva TaxID=51549 RepID=UPI00351E4EDC